MELRHVGEDHYELVLGGVKGAETGQSIELKHTLTEAQVNEVHSLTKLKRNYTRLAYKEWNKLDDLLGMHGWGGYYDLVECIKGDLSALGAEYCSEPGTMLDIPQSIQTLPEAMELLHAWSSLIGNWRMRELRKGVDWGEEVRTPNVS